MELRGTGEPGQDRSAITDYRSLSIFAGAAAISVMAAAMCGAGMYREAAGVAVAALALGLVLSARASIESLLLIWFATSPLVSLYLQFPREQSVITYDRVVFALVLGMLVLRMLSRDGDVGSLAATGRPGVRASGFEIAWAALAVLALLSAAIESTDTGYGARVAIDSFCLPLIAFHFARYRFQLRGRARVLLAAAMALALFLFVTGVYEFRTGTNLFPYKGSELMRAGEIRVNGPFMSDSSYAIISLLLGLFLILAPRALRVRMDWGARLIYIGATLSALLASLLPLFRAVAIALVVCGLVTLLGFRKGKEQPDLEDGPAPPLLTSRSRITALLALVLLTVAAMGLLFNGAALSRRLSSPKSAYGRLATWKAAIEIAGDRPLFGVGLTNYDDYFQEKFWSHDRSGESLFNEQAVAFPHSNPLWIAAEMGVFAFALYVAANVYIFLMGYRAYKGAGSKWQRAAAICYLALVFAYWIPGLTLTSGIYSDLNLYLFFLLGLLLNIYKGEEAATLKRAEAGQTTSGSIADHL